MLCSKCNEVVKPVVAVDVDGTLGDYHGHFLGFAADWLNKGLEPLLTGSMQMYGGIYPFSSYCQQLFDIDLKTYRDIKLAYRQGGMKRTMPIFDGATKLCAAINAADAELWITTTRPYLSLDNIVPDTIEWLTRHGIAFDGLLFDEDKYEQLARRVDRDRVVAIVDDLPEMYDAAYGIFGSDVPILASGSYNYLVTRPRRGDLIACRTLVLNRIWGWRHA